MVASAPNPGTPESDGAQPSEPPCPLTGGTDSSVDDVPVLVVPDADSDAPVGEDSDSDGSDSDGSESFGVSVDGEPEPMLSPDDGSSDPDDESSQPDPLVSSDEPDTEVSAPPDADTVDDGERSDVDEPFDVDEPSGGKEPSGGRSYPTAMNQQMTSPSMRTNSKCSNR